LNESSPHKSRGDAVVIKKYANRRLYNTETSTYVTLEDLAQMVRSDRDFVVRDAKSGADLTHSVLTQIIVEQESRAGGPTLLPIPFLRQLIRYYDDSIGKMVPGYLQFSLEALTKEHERFKSQFASAAWRSNPFEAYQDQARRNLEIFERAMAMWSPFNPATSEEAGASVPTAKSDTPAAAQVGPETTEPGQTGSDSAEPAPAAMTAPATQPGRTEIDALKAELAAMQRRIESLSKSKG
jgi:polyhydroxyalkanoate synthesis repressor PhaR